MIRFILLIKTLVKSTFAVLLISLFSGIEASQSPLFFTCDSSQNWDIYSINMDGTGLKRLTETSYDEKSIALSPNRQLLVTACSDGWVRIITSDKGVVIDSFTTLNKPSTANQPQFYDSSVIFTELIDKKRDLWIIQEYREGVIREKVRMYGSLFYPVTAPGSKSIVYTYNLCTSGCRSMITELWYYDGVSRMNRQLTLLNTHISSPVYFDQNLFVFSAQKDNVNDLFMIDIQKGTTVPLLADNDDKTFPAISPDKNHIAYLIKKGGNTTIAIYNISKKKKVSTLSPIKGRYLNLVW